jgi:hypothetical protein
MSSQVDAISIGKWSVGSAESQHMTILSFEFKDRANELVALRGDLCL